MSVIRLISRSCNNFGEEARSKLISAVAANDQFSTSSYLTSLISRTEDPAIWSDTFSKWFQGASEDSNACSEIITFLILSEMVGFNFKILEQYSSQFQSLCKDYCLLLLARYDDALADVTPSNNYDLTLSQLLESGTTPFEMAGPYIVEKQAVDTNTALVNIIASLLNTPYPTYGILNGDQVKNNAKHMACLVFTALNTMRNMPDYSISVTQIIRDNFSIHLQSDKDPAIIAYNTDNTEEVTKKDYGKASVIYSNNFVVIYNGYQILIGGPDIQTTLPNKKVLANKWSATSSDLTFTNMVDFDGKDVLFDIGTLE